LYVNKASASKLPPEPASCTFPIAPVEEAAPPPAEDAQVKLPLTSVFKYVPEDCEAGQWYVMPLRVVAPDTVSAETVVVASSMLPATNADPETVKAEVLAFPKMESPVTFKVDWRKTGPVAVRLVVVVVANVEVPETDSVPESMRLVNDGESTTAIVEVPEAEILAPGVSRDEISRYDGAAEDPLEVRI